MRDLLLLGASGLAREATAALSGHRVVGVLDDDQALRGHRVGGVLILGGLNHAADLDTDLLICVGSGAARQSIAERLEAIGVGAERFATLVHPSVDVPNGCRIGPGSLLLAGVVLTADVTIGRHVVVMPNCTLTHDDVIDDYATLAAGVSLGGGVHVGQASYLGMNSAVRQHVTIGGGAMVGMGAAVLNDVPAGQTWVGVPAAEMMERVSG